MCAGWKLLGGAVRPVSEIGKSARRGADGDGRGRGQGAPGQEDYPEALRPPMDEVDRLAAY
jgi:hypothetical protein